MLWQLSLKSALRFSCMQAVTTNCVCALRAPSTIIGSCGALRPTRSGGAATSRSGSTIADVGDGRMAASSGRASRTCGIAWAKACDGRSLEQIADRLALEHGGVIISHEYHGYMDHRTAQKDYWHRLLPRHKLRRGRRRRPGGSPASFIEKRRSIAERPAEVEGRETKGHWEADFMLFARYGQGLLVLHGDKPLQRRAAPARSKSCPDRSDIARHSANFHRRCVNHQLRQRN